MNLCFPMEDRALPPLPSVIFLFVMDVREPGQVLFHTALLQEKIYLYINFI